MIRPELDGMRGGSKQMWLRQHQSEIVDYWRKHGSIATLLEFRIGISNTLESLLDRAGVTLSAGWKHYEGGDATEPQNSGKSLITLGKQKHKNRLIYYLPDAELKERQDPYGLGLWAKHRWLQFHRDEVIDHYRGHVFQSTCIKYHCTTETLGHLLGIPHDKKGKLKWKSAVPLPRDYTDRQVALLRARVMEEIECLRAIREQNFKLRRDINAFILMAIHSIARALENAFPERDISDLIQQEIHKLPSLLEQTPASSIGIPELYQTIVTLENDRYDGLLLSGKQCPRCAGSMLPDKDDQGDVCLACGNRNYWENTQITTETLQEVKVGR